MIVRALILIALAAAGPASVYLATAWMDEQVAQRCGEIAAQAEDARTRAELLRRVAERWADRVHKTDRKRGEL